jgi:hypothetical protein
VTVSVTLSADRKRVAALVARLRPTAADPLGTVVVQLMECTGKGHDCQPYHVPYRATAAPSAAVPWTGTNAGHGYYACASWTDTTGWTEPLACTKLITVPTKATATASAD